MDNKIALTPGTSSINTAAQKNDEALRKACQEFESVFLSFMFKEMRTTVPREGGILDQSSGEEIFQGMMDQELSGQISKASSLGMGESLYRQLKALEKTAQSTDLSKENQKVADNTVK